MRIVFEKFGGELTKSKPKSIKVYNYYEPGTQINKKLKGHNSLLFVCFLRGEMVNILVHMRDHFNISGFIIIILGQVVHILVK